MKNQLMNCSLMSALLGNLPYVLVLTVSLAAIAGEGEPAIGDPLSFHVQALAVDTNECCAVADVNRDGKLDVIAGRNWFAAPDFLPRPLRMIGEFGADYSENNGEHVMDVNSDGWPDVVAGSFVPSTVHWYENPKEQSLNFGKQWTKHLLADTGNSANEMTFLQDINGDGQPEYVVNNWVGNVPVMVWSFTKDEAGNPILAGHRIGAKNGHGMGFGDINGDDRVDIVFERGWYEQPEGDPFAAEWVLHEDFAMPGASCPMIVMDLNKDGRNDIIWGRGHDYGLYWMEQLEPSPDGKTKWKMHDIDRSFSQAHTLLWTDIDGDGQGELITGKRVRAHSGGDPGAKDPPVLYCYEWNIETRSFTRHEIATGRAGTGLQIRAGDMNGDGLVDLVVAGKSGTFILFREK